MLRISVRKQLREFHLAVDLAVPDGVTVVVGSSGAGKTTLLRLIAGLSRPDAGSVILGGHVLCDEHRFVAPYRRHIGMVFQEYALFPHLDVAANVGYGLRARGLPSYERAGRVSRILDRFEIGKLGDQTVDRLSGGQRQRVALARALAIEPAALLLDEPLSALDPLTRRRVREELRLMLVELRVPTLLVTHDEADRETFGVRTVRLETGRLSLDPRASSL